MSEFPGRGEAVDNVDLGVKEQGAEKITRVESTDEWSAIDRRVGIRNREGGVLSALGIGAVTREQIILEEGERVDEEAVKLVSREVVMDIQEARKIVEEERSKLTDAQICSEERAVIDGHKLYRKFNAGDIDDAMEFYWDRMDVKEMSEFEKGCLEKQFANAVKRAIVKLMKDNCYGSARDVFFRGLSIVEVSFADLLSLGVTEDQFEKFKEALLYDLVDALQENPYIFSFKKEAVKRMGLLNDGQVLFNQMVINKASSILSAAKAKNEQFFLEMRDYFYEIGLPVSVTVLVNEDSVYKEGVSTIAKRMSGVLHDFIDDNPYFLDFCEPDEKERYLAERQSEDLEEED